MKNELCPVCNEVMKIDQFIDEYSFILKCKHCRKAFKFTYDEKTFPANINSFNWGAFALWELWGFWNNIPYLSIMGLTLCFTIHKLVFFYFLVKLSVGLYLGICGNRISWREKEWSSIKKFEECQAKWKIVGIIVIGVRLIAFLYGLLS